MVNTDSIPIRTVEAIDAEIDQLVRDVEAQGEAVSWQEARIDLDEFDAGTVRVSQLPRGRDGRLISRTSTLNASTYITAARRERNELRAERSEMRRRIADLRAERRLWSDKTPLGTVEIAAMLGYSADAPRQWKHRNVLPAPAGSVSGTPYWWRGDVLGWALQHGRTRAIVELERDDDEYGNDYAEAM